MEDNKVLEVNYNIAVHTIKNAILQSQYQAIKLINREQLALYYGIGRYISQNSRDGYWGTGAIGFISKRLQSELILSIILFTKFVAFLISSDCLSKDSWKEFIMLEILFTASEVVSTLLC